MSCPAIITDEAGRPGHNWPSGSSCHPKQGMGNAGTPDCNLCRLLLLLGCRDRDGGELHCCQGQWVALVRALEPCRTEHPACSLGPPAHLLPGGQWVCWKAPGRRLVSASYLTPHLTTTTPTNCWLNGPLTVACWQLAPWGMGPIVPTNCWAGPLAVAHWQLAVCRLGPLWCQPMAEQDH